MRRVLLLNVQVFTDLASKDQLVAKELDFFGSNDILDEPTNTNTTTSAATNGSSSSASEKSSKKKRKSGEDHEDDSDNGDESGNKKGKFEGGLRFLNSDVKVEAAVEAICLPLKVWI
jgi:hypothetical protein